MVCLNSSPDRLSFLGKLPVLKELMGELREESDKCSSVLER